MRSNRILSVFLCVLMIGSMFASMASAAAPKIGLAISTLNNPFFVDLRDGALEEAKKAGLGITVADAQNDPNRQLSQVENFIQQGVNIILVNPCDSAAIVSAIKAANRAKIPVITVDRGADGGEVICHIASDNVQGGQMAGEYLAKLIGYKGKVVEIQGIPGASAARDRGKGFNEVMKKYPNIKIVARQEAGFDRAKGMTVMENILQAQPDIDGVFCHNDEMALGALRAIEAAGRLSAIKIVGFDATDDAIKAVQDGKLVATVAQKPRAMGSMAVTVAKRVLDGAKVDAFIPVPLELVAK
ncbi:MAG TPA: ribose ABC transporter substrate-binding protein RbsB [Bacillota bacterium]|nr:ribose ABC transporter substrate-binding protein RbsB [Bacillota bacterium]HPQ01973.1 ribose ABC transporter substrate-binding protein RbsB [Bacillota bacterium]HPZ13811.1 ribose ABC transporter substrate-binding protein RbsB [Bacillota bacterium]HQD80204.1 ribose ABC transporter substrate-binding protein RbsB [Bacillota bacterium]